MLPMKLNVKKIKREMARLGWTMETLAQKCGLKNRQAVWYYFNSESIRGADKFAKALDVDPKDLIK